VIVHSGLYKPVDAPMENWPIEESPNAYTANDTSNIFIYLLLYLLSIIFLLFFFIDNLIYKYFFFIYIIKSYISRCSKFMDYRKDRSL